jgi:hypothetical protein
VSDLWEMVAHPYATLRKLYGLDRLPDRRVSRSSRTTGQEPADPLRRFGPAEDIYRGMGLQGLEETRVDLYPQFREMDGDPMIAAVLDAFGDDAGQVDSENKRVVWCESDNPDITRIAHRTMDRLGIESAAFPIMRSLARDGDVLEHVALARGEGVVALRAYEPWAVARIEDQIGRLIGFSPADERGEPARKDQAAVEPYKVLHFRLPPRERTQSYGAGSSFLWGSRIIWREYQLMEDQVVIQRLLRRPDRILILMDATGMAYEEAWQQVKEWERRWHREWHLNPTSSEFRSQGLPLDGAKDMILPRGQANQTQVQAFPATNTNDLLRDVDLFLSRLAAGIGFPLGFIGRGEAGAYTPGQSLSRQYQPFAKRAMRLQRAFLTEIVRLLQIDMAVKGLDPYNPSNAFKLSMASVAPIVEIERAEVIQLRMDRMERAINFGTTSGLNLAVWVPFVLEKYGGLPRELVKELYSGAKDGTAPDPMMSERGAPSAPDRRALEEAIGSVLPEVDDVGCRVSSSQVTIDGRGADRYTPVRALNESAGTKGVPAQIIQAPNEPFADLARSEAADRAYIDSRRKRAQTRVRLVTSLAGMPQEAADEWERRK